jgi:hypothetical protein
MMPSDDFKEVIIPSPFHIAEYQAVYDDILDNHKIGFNVVTYTTIANAFMVGWFIQNFNQSNSKPYLSMLYVAMPIVLTLFSIVKFRQVVARIRFLFNYLYKMEKDFRQGDLGLQHYYRYSSDGKYLKHRHIAYLALFVQLVLLVGFAYLALIGR